MEAIEATLKGATYQSLFETLDQTATRALVADPAQRGALLAHLRDEAKPSRTRFLAAELLFATDGFPTAPDLPNLATLELYLFAPPPLPPARSVA